MKRKYLFLILAVLVVMLACIMLVACNGNAKIVSVEGGEIDGEKITLELGPKIKTLDLAKVIKTKNSTFKVFEDEDKKFIVPDKMITLSDGENKYYIDVEAGKAKKTYELNIWKNYKVLIDYYVNGKAFDSEYVLTHTYLEDFRHPVDLEYGMEFLGWDCEGHYVEDYKRFDAKLRYQQYTVTLDADGGECVAGAAIVALGVKYQMPVPTKTGYTFKGWYYNGLPVTREDGTSYKYDECWKYTGDLTLTAMWQVNKYSIKVVSNMDDVNEGGIYNFAYNQPFTVNYGKLKKLGYKFLGWYKDGVKIGDGYNLTLTATENITIEKRWEYDASLDVFDYYVSSQSYEGIIITNTKVTDMTSLVIPDGIYGIKAGALSGLGNLEELTIPFVGLKESAYSNDRLFGSIFGKESYQNSVEVEQKYNHNYTYGDSFYIPQSLRKVTVTSQTDIAEGTFENCSMLREICFEKEVTKVGKYAFSGCTALETITIGNKAESIGESAFAGCTSLAAVDFSDSVTFVGKNAFANTAWLDAQTDGLVYVGKTLYTCKGTMQKYTSIVVKVGTVYIAEGAFEGCGTLFGVYIPKSVVKMGADVFDGCGEVIVACEAQVKPNDWDANWKGNCENLSVNWNIPIEEFIEEE